MNPTDAPATSEARRQEAFRELDNPAALERTDDVRGRADRALPRGTESSGADGNGEGLIQSSATAEVPTADAGTITPRPHRAREGEGPRTLFDRIEAFISRLSVRDNFWNSVCSLIWLPLAFFSGIRMKQVGSDAIAAVLPSRRFNRNWYRAMAGGALLANSEIAGGMYVFGLCGSDYTVVCKHLEYRFLRPCFGPAVYRMNPREDIRALLANGGEFNITLDLDILQQASRLGERDKRVGQSVATFHVTPKSQHKNKRARKAR